MITTTTVHALATDHLAWIPTGPGKSFRPLRFDADGWSELMRLEPGAVVSRHRHTGEVHGFNLAGCRQLDDTGEIVGPGGYVYEPNGNVDSWRGVGDGPCIVHIKVVGAVEFLDDGDRVVSTADSAAQHARYVAWCADHGVEPDPRLRLRLRTA